MDNKLSDKKKKIVFFLAYENSFYEGVVRPFINWAKYLRGTDVYIICYRCGDKLKNFLRNIKGIRFFETDNLNEIVLFLKRENFDFIMSDDQYNRLNIINKIKSKTGIKTLIYVQVLFGIHSIADVFNLKHLSFKEKILFKASKLFPFSVIKFNYKKMLSKQDIVIANSEITATFLHTLYGIEPNEIIYPPLNTSVFKPREVAKKKQVLVYLGSNAGDTNEGLIKEICNILSKKNIKILTLGNSKIMKNISKYFDIHPISGVSDEELSKIYSECMLTICPQKWEMFGYVIAESVACGTPVLSFNIMGPKEIIENTGYGILVNNSKNFLNIINNIESLKIKLKKLRKNNPIFNQYEKLLKVIENE
jgi:glycosyltransferase involved in cell wall biosynthesis